ncbi:hypothetical protein MTR_4g037710 [Medicago truncatula]|uniref:Uncharacterized protein n=1 Tax=Medicago truncatula TaxID=3880 RepID=A0A072UJ95_MEDTR|nr:hypothetical protein MTR_4g037710 [Medicago truncatula]
MKITKYCTSFRENNCYDIHQSIKVVSLSVTITLGISLFDLKSLSNICKAQVKLSSFSVVINSKPTEYVISGEVTPTISNNDIMYKLVFYEESMIKTVEKLLNNLTDSG